MTRNDFLKLSYEDGKLFQTWPDKELSGELTVRIESLALDTLYPLATMPDQATDMAGFHRWYTARETLRNELKDAWVHGQTGQPWAGGDYSERFDVETLHAEHEQATISAAMSALGRRTSPRKSASSAANGKKGGRPRKPQPA